MSATALIGPQPVHAGGDEESTTGTSTTVGVDDGADVVFAGVTTYQGGYRGKRTGGCGYEYATGYLSAIPTTAPPSYVSKGIRYSLFVVSCPGAVPFTRYIPDPPPRSIAPAARAALDRRFLPAPEVASAPSADSGIVTLGQWFWTTTAFAEYSATAAVPQLGIYATATATPTSLTFYPGDGNTEVLCEGPGEPWLAEYGDELESDCMYTYMNSSAIAANGETFPAALQITWTVAWTASDGSSGTLPNVNTITTFDQTVKELQAIIIYTDDA
jgi:hypothetical protein